jgi:Nuclease-related domain
MAGESARDQARRQREKAARLVASADRWERGADGEVVVAAAMAELEASGWTLLHDLAWPGRKNANIDHVAIGNGRVFVIDANNWTGDVATAGGVLRQNGRSRAKEVAAAADAARAVAGLVTGLPLDAVRPVLCLVRDDWFSERFGGVLVCSSHNLVAQLRGQQESIESPSPQHIAQLTAALSAHGHVGHQVHARRLRTANRRNKKDSRRGITFKMAAAVATVAVLLTQPAWFTSALHRASEEFVSLIAPSTSDPAPAEKSPGKEPQRRKQGKVKPSD